MSSPDICFKIALWKESELQYHNNNATSEGLIYDTMPCGRQHRRLQPKQATLPHSHMRQRWSTKAHPCTRVVAQPVQQDDRGSAKVMRGAGSGVRDPTSGVTHKSLEQLARKEESHSHASNSNDCSYAVPCTHAYMRVTQKAVSTPQEANCGQAGMQCLQ